MQILLTGDIHLGRVSTHFPDDGVAGRLPATALAWGKVVDFALENSVGAVVISGDVIDGENKRWESFGPLAAGLERLSENNIQTILVAGNHDYDSLPAVIEQINLPNVHLLGRNAKWQRYTLKQDGRNALHIDGFSFNSQYLKQSPLDSYNLPPDNSAPVLGLVHGEMDNPQSQYAPLSSSILQNMPVQGWLLGHIHKPDLLEASEGNWILYPGSPQPLDPGEPGAHGLWLCDIENGQISVPKLVAISKLRYETLTIDITGKDQPQELNSFITDSLKQAAQNWAQESQSNLEAAAVRLHIKGTSSLGRFMEKQKQEMIDGLNLSVAGAQVFIEKIQNDIRPKLDIEKLKQSKLSAIGLLASLVDDFENNRASEEAQSALETIERNIQNNINTNSRFKPLENNFSDDFSLQDSQNPYTPATIKELALSQSRELLTQLVEQSQ